jgi:capsular polysaccharide biosynthesis protein
METSLKHYWDVVQQRLPAVLLLSAAAALVAWLVVRDAGPTYQVHFSYLVSLSEREAADEFRFDGYYALSATDLFAGTLAQWLQAPEVLVSAYQRAGVPLPSRDSRQLGRSVSAEKVASQLVAVTVYQKDRTQAERLAQGLQAVMADNIDVYHDLGAPALSFRAVATEPWVGVHSLSQLVISVAAFVFMFFVVINLIVLRESIGGMS